MCHACSACSARFIGDAGFSIGIDDVTPAPLLCAEKAATVDAGYAECDALIAQHRTQALVLAAGCDADESLEAAMTQALNNIREKAAKVGVGGVGMGG